MKHERATFNKEEYERLKETCTASQDIFQGKILHVLKDRICLPNGKEAFREVIAHVGAVCVVPLTEDGQVIVERQFRYPVDEVITEIPAGKLEGEEEDPLEGAKRELKEETGLTADTWTDLGLFYPAAAYSAEIIRMYMAEDLHQGSQKLDEDEFLDVKKMPLMQLIDEIMDGKVPDAKTQAAVLKAARLKGI